jgi:prephenate dehydratase
MSGVADGMGITGIQGGPGSFNDRAFRLHVGTSGHPDVRYFPATEPLLRALRQGEVDHAQFALESNGRLVEESVDAVGRHILAGAGLRVVRCYEMATPYCLMSLPGTKVVRRIIAHPVAMAECRRTLAERYATAVLQEGIDGHPDPTTAAQSLVAGDLPADTAILGCGELARGNHLEVTDPNLSDDDTTSTTFVLVSLDRPAGPRWPTDGVRR